MILRNTLQKLDYEQTTQEIMFSTTLMLLKKCSMKIYGMKKNL